MYVRVTADCVLDCVAAPGARRAWGEFVLRTSMDVPNSRRRRVRPPDRRNAHGHTPSIYKTDQRTHGPWAWPCVLDVLQPAMLLAAATRAVAVRRRRAGEAGAHQPSGSVL